MPTPATKTYTKANTALATWFERDRAHVLLYDPATDTDLVEWWDWAVKEAIEDGYLDPKDFHGSAVAYYNEMLAG